MPTYEKVVRVRFTEEDVELNVGVHSEKMNQFLHYLIEYGIDAEDITDKVTKGTRRYARIHVFGRDYTSVTEFANVNGFMVRDVYKYNSSSANATLNTSSALEKYLAKVIAERTNSNPIIIRTLLLNAKEKGYFSKITLDPDDKTKINVYHTMKNKPSIVKDVNNIDKYCNFLRELVE
jgi:hypothetical protein